jgi:hypothetical protein
LNNFRKSKTNIDLKSQQSQIVLDGGNVVDNYRDKAIITSRVVTDNTRMSENEVNKQINNKNHNQIINAHSRALNYSKIAIIEEQGDKTGHSDGMVSFIDDNVIAVHTDGMTGKSWN